MGPKKKFIPISEWQSEPASKAGPGASADAGASWADEMDDMPVVGSAQPGFATTGLGGPSFSGGSGAPPRRGYGGSAADDGFSSTSRGAGFERASAAPGDFRVGGSSAGGPGGYGIHDVPMPTQPPFTAHIGNLSFDATDGDIGDFFTNAGAQVKSIRLLRDRETDRPRGFGYVEFEDLESLKTAVSLSGSSLVDRAVRVTVAEGKSSGGGFGREPDRELDWSSARSARGPLPPLEPRGGRFEGGPRRGGYGAEFEGEGRPPRAPERELDWGSARGARGPLPPLEPRGEKPERGYRSPRSFSGAEGAEKPERRLRERETGPELDWSRRGPPPAVEAPAPAERKKLQLAPRTNSTDGSNTPSGAAAASPVASSKASPFGAARAVDTTAAEQRAEEKRLQAQKEREEAAAARRESQQQSRRSESTRDVRQSSTQARETASDSKTKRFDSRTDKPFDVLKGTADLSIDEDGEQSTLAEDGASQTAGQTESATRAAAQAAAQQADAEAEAEEGWSTVRK
ncbi:Eukaryotic translation initiation factor 4B [Savitreella phatthalungensis]